MANDTHKRYQVLALNPEAPQGACCTNFPDCQTLLVPGHFFVAFFPVADQNAIGAIGCLKACTCGRCGTPQAIPQVFEDMDTAQRWADLMNGMGHHGQAPLINFRPSATALVGTALQMR